MKKELLPDFAKPYKTKGFDVRLVRGCYQLFKISSKRVEGKSYPVLTQIYIGTIDPVKGLVEKKLSSDELPALVEYGLSNFILKHFKRDLIRSMYNINSEYLLILAVIYFMYGHFEERFVKLSFLYKSFKEQTPIALSDSIIRRLKKAAGKISEYFENLIPDKSDRDYLIVLLREIRVKGNTTTPAVSYQQEIKDILDRYEVKYE